MPKGSNLPAPIIERRANASATAWAIMIMTIGALAAVLYFARDEVVRVWPQSIKLYETLGVPVSGQAIAGLIEPGLELRDIDVARGGDPSTIVVSGTIINPTNAERAVTALEARLLSGNDEVLALRRLEVEESSIPPGGSLSFQHELRDLPDGVARIRMIIATS